MSALPEWLNLHQTVHEPVAVEDLEPVETVVALAEGGDMVEFRVRRDLIGTVPASMAIFHYLRFGRAPRFVVVNLADGRPTLKKRKVGAREAKRLVEMKIDDNLAREEYTGESRFRVVPIDAERVRAAVAGLTDGYGEPGS